MADKKQALDTLWEQYKDKTFQVSKKTKMPEAEKPKVKRAPPARDPVTGKFMSKSALADLASRNNAGKPKPPPEEPSPVAMHNIGNFNQVIDPFVLLSVLRNQHTALQKVIQEIIETNEITKKNGDTETEATKQVATKTNAVREGVKSANDSLHKIEYGILELDPAIKETEKYSRYTTVLLQEILDTLNNFEQSLRTVPFQLNQLHEASQTCCKEKGHGGEGGGALGDVVKGLALVGGAYGLTKAYRALRGRSPSSAQPRENPPVEPSEPPRPSARGSITLPEPINPADATDLTATPSEPLALGFDPAPLTMDQVMPAPKVPAVQTLSGELIPPPKPLVTTPGLAKTPPTIDVFPDKNPMQIPEMPKIEQAGMEKTLGNAAGKIAGFLVKQGISRALRVIPGVNVLSRLLEPNTSIMDESMEQRLVQQGNAQHAASDLAKTAPTATTSITNTKEAIQQIPKHEVATAITNQHIRDRGIPYVGDMMAPGTATAQGITTYNPYGMGFSSDRINMSSGGPRVGQSFENLPPVNITGVGGSKHSAKEAIDFFVKKGYTQEQAAGIAANLQRESGLNPAVVNSTGHAGIAQWDGRRQQLFYQKYGKPLQKASFDEQLDFVDWELNNTEKSAGDAVKAAKTAAQSGQAFGTGYERYGFHPGETNARMSLAQSFDKQYAELKTNKNNSAAKIQQADESKAIVEAKAKSQSNQPVVVNAPTNVTTAANQQPVVSPMPRSRTDDPVFLRATQDDMAQT